MRSLLPFAPAPALDFCLNVINDAFVPCPGDQTLLWKVGEEEKNPPGQSWEWHLDLCPLKGWKAGRLSPLTSPLQTGCSWFLLIQSWADTAIKGLKSQRWIQNNANGHRELVMIYSLYTENIMEIKRWHRNSCWLCRDWKTTWRNRV